MLRVTLANHRSMCRVRFVEDHWGPSCSEYVLGSRSHGTLGYRKWLRPITCRVYGSYST